MIILKVSNKTWRRWGFENHLSHLYLWCKNVLTAGFNKKHKSVSSKCPEIQGPDGNKNLSSLNAKSGQNVSRHFGILESLNRRDLIILKVKLKVHWRLLGVMENLTWRFAPWMTSSLSSWLKKPFPQKIKLRCGDAR